MIKHGIDTVTDASPIGPTWQSSLLWTSVALTEFFLFELQKDEAGERPFCSEAFLFYPRREDCLGVPTKETRPNLSSDLAEN